MKAVATTLTLILSTVALSAATAATFTFEALADFTDIYAGEVPYYRHNPENALAIDAAVESYRYKFARATVIFDQTPVEHGSGLYDVTITSLGETDGDGEFRFLVNGEVVGSAVNAPASEDYVPQNHIFTDIFIPQGALIGVESSAVSNGLIPEGNAFAFARGRWTTLTISDADSQSAPDPVQTIDLSIQVNTDNTMAVTGDVLTYAVTVINPSNETIATNPSIEIVFPPDFTILVADNQCDVGDYTMTCAPAELAANRQNTWTITARASTAGVKTVTASVVADQTDSNNSNNNVSNSITVSESSPTDTAVDISIDLSSDKSQAIVGDSITYTATLTNSHDSNTATSPLIDILLPPSLQFQFSDICTTANQSVVCEVSELAPGSSAQATFTVLTVNSDTDAQLTGIAESAQQDNNQDNNQLQHSVTISAETIKHIAPEIQTPNTQANEKSGGGGLSYAAVLLLLLGVLGQYRKLMGRSQRYLLNR